MNEKKDTETVTEGSQQQGQEGGGQGRERIPHEISDRERYRACHQAFHCDNDQRVFGRNMTRKIVVHAPENTGCQDPQCADRKSPPVAKICGKEDARGCDQADGPPGAASNRFFEGEGCDQCCGNTFEIQEKGCGCRGRMTQAEHQDDRCDHTAGKDCPAQPGQVRTRQARLGLLASYRLLQQFYKEKTKPRTKIEQSSQ